jgi:hypothetical protein
MTRHAFALVVFLVGLVACGGPDEASTDLTTANAAPVAPSRVATPGGDWRARVAADVADLRSSSPAIHAELSSLEPQRTRAGILRFTSTPTTDPRATSVFLDRLARGGGSVAERAALAEVLARTTGIYEDALVDLFVAERASEVRVALVHSARRVSADPAVALLGRALADPDPEIQAEAARVAAGHPAGARAARQLRTALATSTPQVRAETARALGILGVTAAQEELVARLSDGEAEVRLEALRALDRVAPGSVSAATLGTLARDPDERVSRLASKLAQ